MKVFKKSMLLLLMVLSASISSCSKDKDDDNGPNGSGNGVGTFSAKVDGVQFTSISDEAYGILTIVEDNKVIAIGGNDAAESGISLSVERFDGVGEYNIFDLNNSLGIGMYMEGQGDEVQIWNMPVEGEIGKLIITSITKNRIKGNFHFKVLNIQTNTIKTITEGSFDMPYGTVVF